MGQYFSHGNSWMFGALHRPPEFPITTIDTASNPIALYRDNCSHQHPKFGFNERATLPQGAESALQAIRPAGQLGVQHRENRIQVRVSGCAHPVTHDSRIAVVDFEQAFRGLNGWQPVSKRICLIVGR